MPFAQVVQLARIELALHGLLYHIVFTLWSGLYLTHIKAYLGSSCKVSTHRISSLLGVGISTFNLAFSDLATLFTYKFLYKAPNFKSPLPYHLATVAYCLKPPSYWICDFRRISQPYIYII